MDVPLGGGFGRSAWRRFRVHNVRARYVVSRSALDVEKAWIFKIDPLSAKRRLGVGVGKTSVAPPTAHTRFINANPVWGYGGNCDRL